VRYGPRLLDALHGNGTNWCTIGTTPTRTATSIRTNTPTKTATKTKTPTKTATRTKTPTGVAATHTKTRTPTKTRTATKTPTACATCNLSVTNVTITCDANGRVDWTATVNNPSSCAITEEWRSILVSRDGDHYDIRKYVKQTRSFAPGNTVLSGEFCWQPVSGTDGILIWFDLTGLGPCHYKYAYSNERAPCNPSGGCH
jgi:hypothetical protein